MIPITEVRITHRSDARLKAYANVILGGVFVIHGLKVVEGKGGRLFVAMPSRRRRDQSYQDICHPITPEYRKYVENTVLAEYARTLETGSENLPEAASRNS